MAEEKMKFDSDCTRLSMVVLVLIRWVFERADLSQQ